MPLPNPALEPWLRGTRGEVPAILRAVLHALDLACEDFDRWVWPLPLEHWEAQPFALPSVAFQARHIAGSLDRLLTYAEGRQLTTDQLTFLQQEREPAEPQQTQAAFPQGLKQGQRRVLALPLDELEAPRYVGRNRIPVTLAALLVHLADHTQRHAGQAVTTAKILLALQDAAQS